MGYPRLQRANSCHALEYELVTSILRLHHYCRDISSILDVKVVIRRRKPTNTSGDVKTHSRPLWVLIKRRPIRQRYPEASWIMQITLELLLIILPKIRIGADYSRTWSLAHRRLVSRANG